MAGGLSSLPKGHHHTPPEREWALRPSVIMRGFGADALGLLRTLWMGAVAWPLCSCGRSKAPAASPTPSASPPASPSACTLTSPPSPHASRRAAALPSARDASPPDIAPMRDAQGLVRSLWVGAMQTALCSRAARSDAQAPAQDDAAASPATPPSVSPSPHASPRASALPSARDASPPRCAQLLLPDDDTRLSLLENVFSAGLPRRTCVLSYLLVEEASEVRAASACCRSAVAAQWPALLTLVRALDGENAGGLCVYEATVHVRIMLAERVEQSRKSRRRIDALLAAGVLPRLTSLLLRTPLGGSGRCWAPLLARRLILEATWCLTNIAGGTSSQTRAVVDCGAVPALVALIEAPCPGVATQAVWALGNVAGESAACRDLVIEAGALAAVLAALVRYPTKLPTVRICAWALRCVGAACDGQRAAAASQSACVGAACDGQRAAAALQSAYPPATRALPATCAVARRSPPGRSCVPRCPP